MRFRTSLHLAAFLAASLTLAASTHAQDWIWIEAEDAVLTNMNDHHSFAPQNAAEASKLSGGKWMGRVDDRNRTIFGVWDVEVPADATYQFYARKFWKHGPYRVSFDGGPWTSVGEDVALLDQVELRKFVCANWTPAGSFTLTKGKHRFRVEALKNEGAIAFDCFVLSSGSFTPRGTLKPDVRLESQTPGFFAWDPPADAKNSPIDLHWMNESVAGSEGFITTQGEQFVLPKSKTPVRFWGVNLNSDAVRMPPRELDQLASMLASRGINWVRLHGSFYAQEGADFGKIDDGQLEAIRRTVAAFKKHGIYSTLSIYYPVWVKLDAKFGWEDYDNKNPFSILFVNEKFQAIYRNWWKELLTRTSTENPTALKDEPALLSLEIQNEDSVFFYTYAPYRVIPASTSHLFEERFAKWLAAKYGSAETPLKQWGHDKDILGDDVANGRVGTGEPWRWFSKHDQRAKDTVTFLYELQRDFYSSTRDYLRKEIGCGSLVSASNWITANDQFLTPIERASNLAGDFIDRHGYITTTHEGPRAGWLVSQGDRYNDRSALRFEPEKPDDKPAIYNPSFDTTYSDKPTMVSEIDWLEPNDFRGEAPLLCAAYGALQGTDAFGFFAVGGGSWQTTINKFSFMTPIELGQFPAAALIYRQGLVAQAAPVLDASVSLKDLLDLEGGIHPIDPKSPMVGSRHIRYDDTATKRQEADLTGYVDEANSTITSNTRQLTLDHATGLLKIDAPAAKALVGFLSKAGEVKLGDVSIQSDLAYGTIAVVAMDGKPIGESSKLLVQVMSQQQNNGWKTEGGPMKTIKSFGTLPLLVKEFTGTIRLAGERKWNVLRVDPSLAPIGDAKPIDQTLEFTPASPYYILTPR